jgi:hypothetical protein
MLIIRRGDRLPTVAVVQSYLNQNLSGGFISVDGIFGPRTEAAVKQFQKAQRVTPTGIVEAALWNALVGRRWQILDSVDRSDYDDPKHAASDHEDLMPFGQTVLEQFGMCRGGRVVINSIVQGGQAGRVILLRFHGHGSPGTMVISSGRGVESAMSSRHSQDLDRALQELRPLFASHGSIEFHGCRVGQASAGRNLLIRVANAIGVPATAGVNTQYGGGTTTFRFEGPTVTFGPNGQTLKQWASRACQVSFQPPG